MKPACSICFAFLFSACTSMFSSAQGDEGLPLRIENLLAPAGSSEISYRIRHTAYGSETADRLGLEFGYSYGLTEKTEIGLSLTGSYTDNRNADRFRDGRCRYVLELRRYVGCRDEKDTTTRLGTLSAEISRSLSPENETPGVFGWFGIDLLDNRATEGENFERGSGAFNAGLSLYRTYDPIVLRVALGYIHRPPETVRGDRWDRGDTLSVSPSVSFAVNNVVSVSATSSIQVTLSPTLNRQDDYGYRTTSVSMGLGVSLSLRDRTTVYISGSTFAGSGGGASFGAFVRHRLQRRDLLSDLADAAEQADGEGGPSDAGGTEVEAAKGSGGSWWDRHRVRVWGIAVGLAAGAKVRDVRR
ncbi:MAG: hypothetical protein ISN29_07605 [Gammaproteobacteria bacterium AqS3]|nr:hypothetical protein [Gammaproteobacteria bacterium AqS3]